MGLFECVLFRIWFKLVVGVLWVVCVGLLCWLVLGWLLFGCLLFDWVLLLLDFCELFVGCCLGWCLVCCLVFMGWLFELICDLFLFWFELDLEGFGFFDCGLEWDLELFFWVFFFDWFGCLFCWLLGFLFNGLFGFCDFVVFDGCDLFLVFVDLFFDFCLVGVWVDFWFDEFMLFCFLFGDVELVLVFGLVEFVWFLIFVLRVCVKVLSVLLVWWRVLILLFMRFDEVWFIEFVSFLIVFVVWVFIWLVLLLNFCFKRYWVLDNWLLIWFCLVLWYVL